MTEVRKLNARRKNASQIPAKGETKTLVVIVMSVAIHRVSLKRWDKPNTFMVNSRTASRKKAGIASTPNMESTNGESIHSKM